MQASGQHKQTQRFSTKANRAIASTEVRQVVESLPFCLSIANHASKECASQSAWTRCAQAEIVDARKLNADIESFIDPIPPMRTKRRLTNVGRMALWRKGFETPDLSSRDVVVRTAIATHERVAIRAEPLPMSTIRSFEAYPQPIELRVTHALNH